MKPLSGSSPRARGTHRPEKFAGVVERFIPACAGNTRRPGRAQSRGTVHPRVRGEHRVMMRLSSSASGSSPRARGTHLLRSGGVRVRLVHPRVRGEHEPSRKSPGDSYGSSPRARGTRLVAHPQRTFRLVHPRVRGEHVQLGNGGVNESGSSPRARGTHRHGEARRRQSRFIPACAGNTALPRLPCSANSVHPRVRGEHTAVITRSVVADGSSPRARGTRPSSSVRRLSFRFIPACAGNTAMPSAEMCPLTVHPRVRGEHGIIPDDRYVGYGSSPRARGTQCPRTR